MRGAGPEKGGTAGIVSDLFGGPFINAWLPDETLFSLASRQHRLACNRLSSATTKQLFGHGQRGSAHDFPCRIDEFAARTRGTLGDAVSIIRDHTILPFYLPFRRVEDETDAIQAMRGDGIGSLKFRLGLLTSRFRANHPLKACPNCIAQDLATHQVAYWHRAHQLPGAWMCLRHGVPLLVSTKKASGTGRFLWFLPDHANLVEAWPPSADVNTPFLRVLADCSTRLCTMPAGVRFTPDRLAWVYRAQLNTLGLLKGYNKLRMADIAAHYLDCVGNLNSIHELSTLPVTQQQAMAQLSPLLYGRRDGGHPIRQLLVIAWLFADFDVFLHAYGQQPEAVQHGLKEHETSVQGHRDDRPDELLKLLAAGQTVSSAAATLAVDVATAMFWAARAGVQCKRRPKVLKTPIRDQLIRALADGADKQAAADLAGVSIVTVTRLLRTEVGLRQRWMDAKFAAMQSAARNAWTSASAQHPSLGKKGLRLIEPAAFAWLYRNDRAWLSDVTSPSKVRQSRPLISWDRRDLAISQKVQSLLHQLREASPGRKIRIGQVCERIPELKAKMGQIDRLPLTRRLLEALSTN